jgi:hypothetical protein
VSPPVPDEFLYRVMEEYTSEWMETERVFRAVRREWIEHEQDKVDRGKVRMTPNQVKVFATIKSLSDRRMSEAISDGQFFREQVQAAALVLLARHLKPQRSEPHDPATSVVRHPKSERRRGHHQPPPPEPVAPSPVSPEDFCRDDSCSGDCGLPCWDGPHLNVVAERWRRIRQHTQNRAGSAGSGAGHASGSGGLGRGARPGVAESGVAGQWSGAGSGARPGVESAGEGAGSTGPA